MKLILKLLLAAVLVMFVTAVGFGFYLHRLFAEGMPPPCGEDLVSELVSPDGKHVAAVFLRNCGATTAYVTHVNFRRSGEFFSTDSDGVITQGEIYLREGDERTTLEWTSDGLKIDYGGEQVTRARPR